MEISGIIRKILNSYDYDTPGVLTNLSRLLTSGSLSNSGKILVYNTEDLVSFGAVNCLSGSDAEEKYSPIYHFTLAQSLGFSGLCGTLGFLEAGAAKFAGTIPLILKLNTVNFLNEGKLDPTCAVTASVKDALRLGCTAVAFTLYPGSDRSDEMYEDFAEMAREAKSYGLPIIAMLTPKGGSLSKEASSSLDVLAYSTHLASHLGAHICVLNMPGILTELSSSRRYYNSFNINDEVLRVKHILNNAFGGRKIVCFSQGKDSEPEDLFLAARATYKVSGGGLFLSKLVFEKDLEQAGSIINQIREELLPQGER